MASLSPTSASEETPPKEREESEEEEEEEEEEDEEEPQLKYERIGGDVPKVIRADLVSAFCVGSKYIVLSFLASSNDLRLSALTTGKYTCLILKGMS
jgi:vacuolar protein sorting-associated protein 41